MRRLALAALALGLVALGFMSPADAADTRDVAIANFGFHTGTCAAPTGFSDLTVTVNDSVRWTNCDSAAHTVKANGGTFDSDVASPDGLAKGDAYAHKFSAVGDFPYHCRIHGEAMSGTVHVIPATPPTSTSTTRPPTTTTVKPTTTTAPPTTTSTSTTQTTLDLNGLFDGSSTTSSSSTTSTTAPLDKPDDGDSSSGLVIALLVLAIGGVGAGAYAVWRRMQQAA